ncbi:hypothetical protein [Chamaesiphon sp.]|uniref:hypothetical protein n=1 Tax=Chamaesiphon sp. TaxID=2814140 RepID=UPI003593E915
MMKNMPQLDAGATKITILNRSRLKDYIDSILVPRGSANETATYDYLSARLRQRHDAKIILTFAVPDRRWRFLS